MIAVADLSKDEIHALIDAIPLDFARPFLKDNSKEFNRLFPGSTIKKLNDVKMQKSFKNNYKDSFVHYIVASYLKVMKSVVDQKKGEFERDGINENDSFIMALSEEIIPKLFSVYLRYYEISYDQNLLSAINCYNESDKKCDELEKSLAAQKDIAGEVISLKERIQELEGSIETTEQEKQLLQDELEKAHLELDDSRAKLSKLRSKLSYAEGTEIPKEKEYTYSGDYPFLSLCKVINYGDEIRLKRLCDIHDNIMDVFDRDKTDYKYDRLYRKNGPNTIGKYGVWNWKVTDNYKDPSKDYVFTNHNEDCQPISVVFLSGVSSFAELMKYLKEGIQTSLITDRALFAVPSSGSTYLSVLCENSEFNCLSGTVKLKDTVVRVKKYLINQDDIIELDDNVFFYKYITMPITGIYVSVDNALEIVKKIIIDQVTWNNAKQKNIERKDWQSYRNMVKAIPTNDIYREIMEKCMCDKEEAKRLISELERNAEHLMNGDDVSSEILTAIVNNNNELMTKCEDLVEERWRKENQNLIDSEQTRLQLLKDECGKKQKEADNLELQLTTVKAEIEKYQSSIDEKEKLAADVEEKIALQIEKAKQNVADFISNMAFVSPLASAVTSNGNQLSNQLSVFNSHIDCVEDGEIDDVDTFEDELSENLTRIGYNNEQSIEIAQAISFGIFEKVPLVISENAKLIAQCLAAVLNGGNVSEVFVTVQGISIEDLSSAINDNLNKVSQMVCLVHGVFDGYSINLFNALSSIMQNWNNAIILLSTEGTPSKMILPGVWNRSIFIDGDRGFEKKSVDSLHTFTVLDSLNLYDRTIDMKSKEYKDARKSMKLFTDILSNTQIGMYSRYLSLYNVSLDDSNLIRMQLIAKARSIGNTDCLKELFHENGIEISEEFFD